jgi:hypothetical protein
MTGTLATFIQSAFSKHAARNRATGRRRSMVVVGSVGTFGEHTAILNTIIDCE